MVIYDVSDLTEYNHYFQLYGWEKYIVTWTRIEDSNMMEEWCKTTFTGKYEFSFYLFIEKEQDLILFKLRWA